MLRPQRSGAAVRNVDILQRPEEERAAAVGVPATGASRLDRHR
eukprot:COSAG06_NODE_20828_length_779_cov_2.010294_1_plen_42_part_10